MDPAPEPDDSLLPLIRAALENGSPDLAGRLVREYEQRYGQLIETPDDVELLRQWATAGAPLDVVQRIDFEFRGVPLRVTCTTTVEMGRVWHRVDYALRDFVPLNEADEEPQVMARCRRAAGGSMAAQRHPGVTSDDDHCGQCPSVEANGACGHESVSHSVAFGKMQVKGAPRWKS